MKLHSELLVLCDYASISREGKLGIMGIFDELKLQQFPGGIARAYFVAMLQGEPNMDYQLVIQTSMAGKQINKLDIKVHTSVNGKNNILLELVNVGFEMPGDYEFFITDGIDLVGKTVLHVDQVQQQAPVEKKFTLN